jgi:hypothetical protein
MSGIPSIAFPLGTGTRTLTVYGETQGAGRGQNHTKFYLCNDDDEIAILMKPVSHYKYPNNENSLSSTKV